MTLLLDILLIPHPAHLFGCVFTAGSLVNGYRQLWCTVLVLARFNDDYRVFRVIWFVRQPHYKAISKRFS